jgi:hypothetical protein
MMGWGAVRLAPGCGVRAWGAWLVECGVAGRGGLAFPCKRGGLAFPCKRGGLAFPSKRGGLAFPSKRGGLAFPGRPTP